MGTNEKKAEINVLNILFCLLVILIHCMGSAISQTAPESAPYAVFTSLFRLSSFAVQGFVFLSAVKLFMKKDSVPYGTFMLKRIKTVFLPYIVYVLIYYIYKLSVENQSFDVLYFIRSIFLGDMHAHFYFVVLIMQFYLLFPLFRRLYAKGNAAAVTVLSVSVSLAFQFSFPHALKILSGFDYFYTDRTFLTYLAYWTLGAFAGINYEAFKASLLKIKYPVFICFLIFFISALPGKLPCDAFFRVYAGLRRVVFCLHISGYSGIFYTGAHAFKFKNI